MKRFTAFAVATALWFERTLTEMFGVLFSPVSLVVASVALIGLGFGGGGSGFSLFMAIAIAILMTRPGLRARGTYKMSIYNAYSRIFGDGVTQSTRSSDRWSRIYGQINYAYGEVKSTFGIGSSFTRSPLLAFG